MALVYDGAIQRLIDAFAKLPGIGPKGAQRIAFYLLSASDEESQNLIDAIDEVKTKVRFCEVCGNVCESSPCPICADPRRDRGVICVVEEVKDVMSIERTHTFHGLYHVLGGVVSPMDGIGPNDIEVASLVDRVAAGGIKEVILALSPTMEGDTTNFYISRRLSGYEVKLSVIARGVTVGDELEYTDEVTLGRSIINRTEFGANGRQ